MDFECVILVFAKTCTNKYLCIYQDNFVLDSLGLFCLLFFFKCQIFIFLFLGHNWQLCEKFCVSSLNRWRNYALLLSLSPNFVSLLKFSVIPLFQDLWAQCFWHASRLIIRLLFGFVSDYTYLSNKTTIYNNSWNIMAWQKQIQRRWHCLAIYA